LRLGLVPLRLSSAEREQLALRMMYLVAKSHHEGTRRWTVAGLSQRLGLPAIGVAEIAAALETARLLTLTDKDELVPGRDSSDLRLVDILDVVRNQRAGHIAPREVDVPSVDLLLGNAYLAWRTQLGEKTLRDLIA
jgi:hypothetical protein